MRAGYGRVELTPPMGVELAGFGYYLQRRAERVADPLYARAVALEADAGRALIISCDVLGLSRTVCDRVAAHAAGYGLSYDDIIIVSIHTHTGPTIKYHEGCGEVDDGYVSGVADIICRAVDAAFADMDDAVTLTHSFAPVAGDHIYNRAAVDGPVDRCVRGFTITRRSSAPIALISAACHGVFRGRSTAVSADFAGGICRNMEAKGFLPMYLNGLCGDIDPFRPSEARLEEYAAAVTEAFLAACEELEPGIVTGSIPFELRLTPVTAEDMLMASEQAAVNAGGADKPAAKVARIWKDEMLAKLDSLTDSETVICKYLLLGGVPVIALPFEGFTRIGMDIRRIITRDDALTLGCAEELLGYLPTKDDIDRGAYAALESTFLYKRLPVVPGEAERIADVMGASLCNIIAQTRTEEQQ